MPPRKRRDRFRRHVLGVFKAPPPRCERCEGDTFCTTCGAMFSPLEWQRLREREEEGESGG